MSQFNLFQEFSVAAERAEKHAGWLMREFSLANNIAKPAGRALFGVEQCCFKGNSYYEPMIDGEKAIIIAEAHSHERWKRLEKIGMAEVVDLVAIPFKSRDSWFLRSGKACLLGAENLQIATLQNPIIIYATPLRWLQAGGNGLCILNWEALDRSLFMENVPFHFENVELQQRFFAYPPLVGNTKNLVLA
jgi:hypothetical protein